MAEISIGRPIYTEKDFKEKYDIGTDVKDCDFSLVKKKMKGYVQSKVNDPGGSLKRFFLSLFPIISWLPRYKLKEWLVADVISGITIGVMQIPQGMSYALLAGQHPIYGLYNAFFPVLLYTLLGTSRHVSMGAFAITSLMLGAAVTPLIPDPVPGIGNMTEQEAWDEVYAERIQFSVATIFVVGIFLLGLSLLNLGSIVTYLSDPMISGFTCGAAAHVLVSQFKGLFGVKVGSYSGPFNIVWVIRDVIIALTSLDQEGRTRTSATVVISVICVVFLLATKEINERYKKKLPLGIPIPGEIVVVIIGTGVSYGADLATRYGVIIVGDIPTGLPVPAPPPVGQLSRVVGTAIPIAIVGYSVAVSIAKIFGNNFGYKIKPNQELVAYGVSNTVASFFFCIPAFPSMSRSCVQVDSGGKTQLAGLLSAALILLVLLVIGPLFRTIPRACLAAIIAVAIKGMLRKARDFKPLWRVNKLDGAVWLVSCLSTIFLDVVYGLVTGVCFSLLCVVFRTQFVSSGKIVRISDTEVYRKRNEATKHSDVTVVAFNGPLHYVNKDRLRRALVEGTGIDPSLEVASRKKLEEKQKKKKNVESPSDNANCDVIINCNADAITAGSSSDATDTSDATTNKNDSINCVVLDCGNISFMDSVGVKFLNKISEEYKKIGVHFSLSRVTDDVMSVLLSGGFIDKFGDDVIFVTNHDAVTWWSHHTSSAAAAETTL